jgi:hypothetical protein
MKEIDLKGKEYSIQQQIYFRDATDPNGEIDYSWKHQCKCGVTQEYDEDKKLSNVETKTLTQYRDGDEFESSYLVCSNCKMSVFPGRKNQGGALRVTYLPDKLEVQITVREKLDVKTGERLKLINCHDPSLDNQTWSVSHAADNATVLVVTL